MIDDLEVAKRDYCRALRCWESNNLKLCLSICDESTIHLTKLSDAQTSITRDIRNQLKQLIWFLKIRCLTDEFYVDESLLLNEDDISGDEQILTFNANKTASRIGTAASNSTQRCYGATPGRRATTAHELKDTQHKTGILTGRMPSVSSRQGSRGTSSYRPLTTTFTATQTAFSRSTRPLLKYSSSKFLSKCIYEYLYSAQTVTSRCPDYRQCLEYLNIVKHSSKRHRNLEENDKDDNKDELTKLITLEEDHVDNTELKWMDTFWLVAYGICYFNLHMNRQAEEYFIMGVSNNPYHLDCYTWLIKIYLRTNQPKNVLKTCEDGLKYCKSSLLYNWMSRVQSLLGDLYAANSSLKISLIYCPINIEALANVGHFSFYSDKPEQALKCFDRIHQLSVNQPANFDNDLSQSGSSAQLMNNLAICNFQCGFYHKVLPLFFKSFLVSPNKEVTSDIWYNISFLPLACGLKNMAMACLRLALKNNSQNDKARNNLGVLKYEHLIDDQLHFKNRQEYWSNSNVYRNNNELRNVENIEEQRKIWNEAEAYFETIPLDGLDSSKDLDLDCFDVQPEMFYNMAILKSRRGNLLASVNYCNLYLERDPNNYAMQNLLSEIRQLISHGG